MSSLLMVLVFFHFLFLFSLILKDNSIADIAWGIGFILFSLGMYIDYGFNSYASIAVFTLVIIWGFRLSLHIYSRNRGKGEDFRYKKWRDDWGKYVVIRSYLQVFVLQMLILFLVSSPVSVIFIQQVDTLSINLIIGICISIIGLSFEVVSDYQLTKFKSNPKNKGKIIQTGLWSISRHPNYFGEAVFWWGLGIIALNHQYALLGLIGPALITYLLRYVSGVPMLEEKYKGNIDFQEYAKKTPCFIPKLF